MFPDQPDQIPIEMGLAVEHYQEMEFKTECRLPKEEVICISEIDKGDQMLLPRCTILYRCAKQYGCCKAGHVCSVSRIQTIQRHFLVGFNPFVIAHWCVVGDYTCSN